jgi:DegV family protein with EDD domain
MREYVIVTDSTCDLTDEMVKELGVEVLPLCFTIDGKEYKNYLDGREIKLHEFYNKMIEGHTPKTAQLNVNFIMESFKPFLDKGLDILYISFSSGLFGSCNAVRLAKEQLPDEYNDRKIEIVDSLCASGGEGLLVWMTAMNKKAGASLEENSKYADDLKLHVKHSFTVADLEYLKRGGRIKATAAFAAKLLNIKPVLHVDNLGHLVALSKKHGRRAALNATCENALAGIDTSKKFITIISHADSLEDAEYCKEYMEAKYKEMNFDSKVVLTNIGPVIGAHSGPGTIAVFTITDKRA